MNSVPDEKNTVKAPVNPHNPATNTFETLQYFKFYEVMKKTEVNHYSKP